MNYFSGTSSRRGLYVTLSRVEREHRPSGFTSETFTLFGNGTYKVLALELKRRNQKKMEALETYVDRKKDKIGAAYLSGDHKLVSEIVGAFSA